MNLTSVYNWCEDCNIELVYKRFDDPNNLRGLRAVRRSELWNSYQHPVTIDGYIFKFKNGADATAFKLRWF